MLAPILLVLIGTAILVASTDQFVAGAGRIAERLNVSSVLVGAVILGCGTGLPELALAFHRHSVDWSKLLQFGDVGNGIGFFVFAVFLVILLSLPAVFPDTFQRHSPLILFATVTFAGFLRGSLDRHEGVAMLVGFAIGITWIVIRNPDPPEDPFAPLIRDDYQQHGAYIEAPVMTPLQIEITRVMLGLLGTAVGAQLVAFSIGNIFGQLGASSLVVSAIVAIVATVVPHVVVAVQALKHENERLAIGNMIGSNLFHSLAIGGLVAIIRPYELGGAVGLELAGITLATTLLTYMLLDTEDELSRPQGLALFGGYVGLVAFTVL